MMCNRCDPVAVQEGAEFTPNNECALLPLYNGMRLTPCSGKPLHYLQRSMGHSRSPCAIRGRGNRHQDHPYSCHHGFSLKWEKKTHPLHPIKFTRKTTLGYWQTFWGFL